MHDGRLEHAQTLELRAASRRLSKWLGREGQMTPEATERMAFPEEPESLLGWDFDNRESTEFYFSQ